MEIKTKPAGAKDDEEPKEPMIKVHNPNKGKKTGDDYKVDKEDKEKLQKDKELRKELKDIKEGRTE